MAFLASCPFFSITRNPFERLHCDSVLEICSFNSRAPEPLLPFTSSLQMTRNPLGFCHPPYLIKMGSISPVPEGLAQGQKESRDQAPFGMMFTYWWGDRVPPLAIYLFICRKSSRDIWVLQWPRAKDEFYKKHVKGSGWPVSPQGPVTWRSHL